MAKTNYDPNGNYRVLRPVDHPEATHPDGCIRPGREGDPETVSMAHRADDPASIAILMAMGCFEYTPPAKAAKS